MEGRKMIETLSCPTCNNSNQTTITDPESGEIICRNCGIVILDRIEDYVHEERGAYSMEELYTVSHADCGINSLLETYLSPIAGP